MKYYNIKKIIMDTSIMDRDTGNIIRRTLPSVPYFMKVFGNCLNITRTLNMIQPLYNSIHR